MRQLIENLKISTESSSLVEITHDLNQIIIKSQIGMGLATLYCTHTSASLLIQENADPDVQADLKAFFERIAPQEIGLYTHQIEGSDDMPAHIKSALTQTCLSIPIKDGKLVLGQWQGIYLFEHRSSSHIRHLIIHILGE